MMNLTRPHAPASFVLLLLFLLSAMTGSRCFGDEGIASPSPAPPTEYEPAHEHHRPELRVSALPDLSELPELPSVIGGTPCVPDYWIASSRHCPLAAGTCCVDCPLAYMHLNPDRCYQEADEQSLLNWLQPGVPVCIFVHGSFVNWESVCVESYYTYQWLRRAAPERPLQMIFFTWPSDDAPGLLLRRNINALGDRSEFHGLYLARLIAQIAPEHPICLIGHSHGARLISSSLHLLAGGAVQGHRVPDSLAEGSHIRAVFAAAALDHHWLNPGQRYGCALRSAECILNLRNRHDLPLAFYPLGRPFSRRALARSGFTRHDQRHIGWQSMKLAELDVTRQIGHGHFWPNYYSQPSIAWSITPYVYFPDLVQAGMPLADNEDRLPERSADARHEAAAPQ